MKQCTKFSIKPVKVETELLRRRVPCAMLDKGQRRNEAIFHLDHCEIKTSTLKCQTLPVSDLLGISLTRVSET